jgi:hypothetical protein
MLGPNLKVSHQSTETEVVTETDYYFPAGTWCSVVNVSAGCIDGPVTTKLPSRIYQSFVHIRNGSIVPLHLGAIGKDKQVRKVYDIQQEAVDLHIHPNFENGKCTAAGRLLVDDGEVLDYAGQQNRYNFNFDSDCLAGSEATGIVLNMARTANSSKNLPNDNLGHIVIYNAKSTNFDMSSEYSLAVEWIDKTSTVLPGFATFDSETMQTVYKEDKNITLGMYNISSITFTKKTGSSDDGVYHHLN